MSSVVVSEQINEGRASGIEVKRSDQIGAKDGILFLQWCSVELCIWFGSS